MREVTHQGFHCICWQNTGEPIAAFDTGSFFVVGAINKANRRSKILQLEVGKNVPGA
jgi:hypothetical protein